MSRPRHLSPRPVTSRPFPTGFATPCAAPKNGAALIPSPFRRDNECERGRRARGGQRRGGCGRPEARRAVISGRHRKRCAATRPCDRSNEKDIPDGAEPRVRLPEDRSLNLFVRRPRRTFRGANRRVCGGRVVQLRQYGREHGDGKCAPHARPCWVNGILSVGLRSCCFNGRYEPGIS